MSRSSQDSTLSKRSKKHADSPKKAIRKVNRQRRKKPEGMPKRPLSAYNIFFQQERSRLLSSLLEDKGDKIMSEDLSGRLQSQSQGRLGFAGLAKRIARKWNHLEPADKVEYEALAVIEKKRYYQAMESWKVFRLQKEQEKLNNKDTGNNDESHRNIWAFSHCLFEQSNDIFDSESFAENSKNNHSDNLQHPERGVSNLDDRYNKAYEASLKVLFSKLDKESIDFLTTLDGNENTK